MNKIRSNNRFQRTAHKVRRPLNRDVVQEMTMKVINIAATILILIGTVGCSSVQVRLAGNRTAIHDPITGLYPAVKRDIKMAEHADAGRGIWMGNSSPFCAFLYYLDIPISIVTDTLGLPFDLFRRDKETAQQGVAPYSAQGALSGER